MKHLSKLSVYYIVRRPTIDARHAVVFEYRSRWCDAVIGIDKD